jgi:hypothetical protein
VASPYAVHRRVENTYLVRERDRRLLRELTGVLAAVLVLGGGLFAYTWVHIEILRTGYRVDEMEKRLHKLLEVERQWRLEAAYLAHPERLAERAGQKLGMVEPTLEQTLFFEEVVKTPPRWLDATPREDGL